MASVWVAYVGAKQHYVRLDFVEGMTVQDAIQQSGILNIEQVAEPLICGIFGVKIQDMTMPLSVGDRVELYRPLTINPKEIRRNRAEKNPTSRYLVKQRAMGRKFRHQSDEK